VTTGRELGEGRRSRHGNIIMLLLLRRNRSPSVSVLVSEENSVADQEERECELESECGAFRHPSDLDPSQNRQGSGGTRVVAIGLLVMSDEIPLEIQRVQLANHCYFGTC
jgi:hypothetical protein